VRLAFLVFLLFRPICCLFDHVTFPDVEDRGHAWLKKGTAKAAIEAVLLDWPARYRDCLTQVELSCTRPGDLSYPSQRECKPSEIERWPVQVPLAGTTLVRLETRRAIQGERRRLTCTEYMRARLSQLHAPRGARCMLMATA
jgi:hypothetical protein